MCRYCDGKSPDCEIFPHGLVKNDYYLKVKTDTWDGVDNNWVYEYLYINYCPYCGRELRDEK